MIYLLYGTIDYLINDYIKKMVFTENSSNIIVPIINEQLKKIQGMF